MTHSLINRFLSSVIKHGQLTVIMPSGDRHVLGQPADGFPNVAVTLTDTKVARDILLDPRRTWDDGDAYDRQAKKLVAMFAENFAQYEDYIHDDIRAVAIS